MSARLSKFLLAALCLAGGLAAAEGLRPGARVMVDKAGAGHRAIVVQVDGPRVRVAYESAGEEFDEWLDQAAVRRIEPPAPKTAEAPPPVAAIGPQEKAPPEPEPLPENLELPAQPGERGLAEVWLEMLPRASDAETLQFNVARLAAPMFRPAAQAGVPTEFAPVRVVALRGPERRATGFAALENEAVVYRGAGEEKFAPLTRLDLSAFAGHAPEFIESADFDRDGLDDLVVAGGPVVQIYHGLASGGFRAAPKPYRAKAPVRGLAPGKFSDGALPMGVAIIEGENSFRVLGAGMAGLTATAPGQTVKFDRILDLVAGDFDGDGFADVALTTESRGRSTGAWMYFNQREGQEPFPWPVGGHDDFARDLTVADLDRDGRADIILTDADVERGSRVRVVFGAGRAGWEDPLDLISAEYGVGLGTASVVTGDFNRDGRTDVGVAGRNGLRIHLGGDYRRIALNPILPRAAKGEWPEHRAFVAGDFDGDGADDLLGFTPVFATGYNLVLNATPAAVPGTHVPPPKKKRGLAQADAPTLEKSTGAPLPSVPQLKLLASRAEPFGPYRYRVIVEIAAIDDSVVASVEARCKYDEGGPIREVKAVTSRVKDEVWAAEAIVPRNRAYTFTFTARDDEANFSEPLRVTVRP